MFWQVDVQRQGRNLYGEVEYRISPVSIYLLSTDIKGISSVKSHRELGMSRKVAWFMPHCRHTAYETDIDPFVGSVEADETCIRDKERSEYADKTLRARHDMVGKLAVVGIKHKETKKADAEVVPDRKSETETLRKFVESRFDMSSQIYSENSSVYRGVDRLHESVNRSAGEFVSEIAHTNRIESFWAMFRRVREGAGHIFSKKHLQSCVDEFSGRHNVSARPALERCQAL